MKIKQLRLSGFKSFANKTVINFDENFIGVVGPNGSGKSNVIDAIRWVFGEKSNKSLRGNSSSDVIFGGTEQRKKLNICEVTIVLDNTDRHLELEFDEVAFTRRLYRNGKSEYLINGVEARYKDVQELILDRGIGKNAFSIISQGKIEEIITTTPENRRVIIEEVAGILKYKKRKENALNKLSKTDENLSQVNMILNEIDERKIPLERQAQIASKFLELKENLENKELTLLATRLKLSEEEYLSIKEITENSKLQLINAELEETNLELSVDNNKQQLSEHMSELNKLNAHISSKLQQLSARRSDLKILKERIKLQEGHDDRTYDLETKLIHMREQQYQTKQQFNQVETKLQSMEHEEIDFQNQLSTLRSELAQINIRQSDLKNELNKVVGPYSTRKLIEANLSGVGKPVIDSFDVELKFTEAISTIIGGRMYDVITNDRESATKAIEYLRKNKYGRQTLLPRDRMRQSTIDNETKTKLTKLNGFISIAIDVVTFNESDYNIFSNLLGNVIICDNIENAKMLSQSINNRYRIVTLEGDVIQTSGAMSGGRSNRPSKIVVESNLAKVKNEKFKTLRKLETIEQKHLAFKDQYTKIKTEYELISSLVTRLQNDIELNQIELNKLSTENPSNSGFKQIEDEINNLEHELEQLGKKQTLLEITKNRLDEQIEDEYITLKNIREEVKTLTNESSKHSVKMERLTISIKNDTNILREEYNMSTQMAQNHCVNNIDIDEYDREVKSIKSKIRNLGPINVLAIEEYEELAQRYEFIDSQRSDLLAAKTKLVQIITNLDEFFITSFEKTFTKLKTEFELVYKELFGGGHATLVLTNEDDLLSSGVEIVAQPPGKKLQTISLLSGGEKSLTAISLLFAILRIKSLPFAILDEVEAALDESNVKRYAKYIKIFSEKTQFIVITHRQGTMEVVDALYGVTMQEKGVSTTVKVTLKEGVSYV